MARRADKIRGVAMVLPEWELHYDRRVADDFLPHFCNGGVARSLAEYARHAPFPLDLQFALIPKRTASTQRSTSA